MSTSPTYPRLAVLAERLAAATNKGVVTWVSIENPSTSPARVPLAAERLPDEPTAFEYRRENGSVQVFSRDKDGYPPFVVRLVRDETPVESLQTLWVGEDEPAPWNDAVATLYRVARSRALGIDEFIDEILGELPPTDDDDVF